MEASNYDVIVVKSTVRRSQVSRDEQKKSASNHGVKDGSSIAKTKSEVHEIQSASSCTVSKPCLRKITAFLILMTNLPPTTALPTMINNLLL